MRWSLPLGSVAGIRVTVHLSFFILVLLVVVDASQPGGLGIASGLLWLILIFASVLIHELAHSLLAQAKGAVVRCITLLPIGGVSQIEGMPQRWADELAIAAVGPLASIGLALLAAVASIFTGAHLLTVNIYGGALLPRLAWLNLILGLFNLLPAFPLDGGRVLRAALQRRYSLELATRMAALAGRIIGAVMVVVGLTWDVWLILVGAFVIFGAAQEEAATIAHVRLQGRKVRQFMWTSILTIDARQPLPLADRDRRGTDVVTLDGRYFGLADAGALKHTGTAVVADVTDQEAPVLAPEEDLGTSALDRLIASGYPALPVLDEGRLVGVLVADDVSGWLANAQSE